ncbi:hypothetical protein D3C78_1668910 [compost metagenome]
MRAADAKFAQAIAELRTIRFPRRSQRATLTNLISGLQTFRHGITAAVKGANANDVAAWRAAERYFTRATASCSEYFKRTFKDRMKGARNNGD